MQTSLPPPRLVFGYRSDLMRRLTPVVLTGFTIFAVAAMNSGLRGDGPLLFACAFAGVAAMSSYWFTWRIGWSIEVDGDIVKWRTLLRTRTLPLDDLIGNDRYSGWERLIARHGRSPILMTPDRGWTAFLERLNAGRPDRPFRATQMSQLGERWPGSRGFNGYYERVV